MTDFKKYILMPFLLAIAVEYADAAPRDKPSNTVILLDLSDRLLVPGQISRDTSIILSLYRSFDADARKELIMTCRNRFSIVVATQESSNPAIQELATALTINLASVPAASRISTLRSFSKGITEKIVQLYKTASQGKSGKDYSGSDLWRYFNEQLPSDLIDTGDNTLLVLSDGYFDFENHNGKLRKGNRYASTLFLNQLPQNGWKETAKANDTGILGVKYKYPKLRVCVTGIAPKRRNQQEVEMLEYFWLDWLSGMDVRNAVVLPSAPAEKTMMAFKKLKASTVL